MTTLKKADISEMRPKITVVGVGGGGGNAVNNMIAQALEGAEFVVANTDAQALAMSKASRLIQLGAHVTEGLGAGSLPEIGRAAAEESIDEIMDHLAGTHMCFVTAGMGGGTGTGAAPVIAEAARGKPTLIVAEDEYAIGNGAMINFVLSQGRVRFEVDLAAVNHGSITLSSRLLAVAQQVLPGAR